MVCTFYSFFNLDQLLVTVLWWMVFHHELIYLEISVMTTP